MEAMRTAACFERQSIRAEGMKALTKWNGLGNWLSVSTIQTCPEYYDFTTQRNEIIMYLLTAEDNGFNSHYLPNKESEQSRFYLFIYLQILIHQQANAVFLCLINVTGTVPFIPKVFTTFKDWDFAVRICT